MSKKNESEPNIQQKTLLKICILAPLDVPDTFHKVVLDLYWCHQIPWHIFSPKLFLCFFRQKISYPIFLKRNCLCDNHHVLSMTHFQAAPSMGICRCLEAQWHGFALIHHSNRITLTFSNTNSYPIYLIQQTHYGQLINECTYITLFKVVDLKYIIHWSGCGKKTIPCINST